LDLAADTARHDIDLKLNQHQIPTPVMVGQLALFVVRQSVEDNHGDLEILPFDLLSVLFERASDLGALCCPLIQCITQQGSVFAPPSVGQRHEHASTPLRPLS
jgi:hypothetical protein